MLTETFLFDYDNLFHTLNTLQFLSALAIAGLLNFFIYKFIIFRHDDEINCEQEPLE